MIWPVLLEAIVASSAAVLLVEALILRHQATGRARWGWALVVLAYGWIVMGEISALAGYQVFIWRWTRATPARLLVVAGYAILVWAGRKRR